MTFEECFRIDNYGELKSDCLPGECISSFTLSIYNNSLAFYPNDSRRAEG